MVSAAMAQTDFRHISYAEGLEAAKAEGKTLFIDFYTEWCGPCKRMARDVFPQKDVGDYMNAKFVCLKIDAEKGEGVELAKRLSGRTRRRWDARWAAAARLISWQPSSG